MSTQPQAIKEALGDNDRKLLKSLAWGMRRNPGTGVQSKPARCTGCSAPRSRVRGRGA